VESVRALARRFAPALPESNFSVETVDDAHFESMLHGAWRVLKPGGLFFCRLASSIGMESQIEHIGVAATNCRMVRSDISWRKPYSTRSPNGWRRIGRPP